jgi:hypothetical protein
MPPSLRTDTTILASMLATMLADEDSPVTDVTPGSVLRTLQEAASSAMADLYYALFETYQAYYLSSATQEDLDLRGTDVGLPRPGGQPASGALVYTREPTWLDDILLPAPQIVQALLDDRVIAYRTVTDTALLPQGRSLSDTAPASSITGGVNDDVRVNLDGDGAQPITLGTQATATTIAAAIQTAVRALTATTPANQPAFDGFRCDWNVTHVGRFTLRSGTAGPTSTVVVTAGTNDATVALKLGASAGGTEQAGQDTIAVDIVADLLGTGGNVGPGQIARQRTAVPGVRSITNPLALSSGRAPASDDAYRQDIRAYLLSLGRGTADALARAALTTSLDGIQYVQSVQFVTAGTQVILYLYDGQSQTLGAQANIVQAVQDEIDGFGSQPGGWLPSGVLGVATPATLVLVNVRVQVLVAPDTDALLAQQAIHTAITTRIRALPIGVPWRYYADALPVIHQAIPGVLVITFLLPTAFAALPPGDVPGPIGQKLIPGTIIVEASHATAE